jgi:hypothetical protein
MDDGEWIIETLLRKSIGERSLRATRCKRKDEIKVYLREISFKNVNWIG